MEEEKKEKRRKNLANWSSRRKGNVVGRSNTTGLEFNLTTRDKSSRGGPSTSLKALGVGIARARAFIPTFIRANIWAGIYYENWYFERRAGTVWRCLARRVHQPRRIKSISGSIERPLCRLDARKDARDRLSDASIRFYNNLSRLPPFVILRYRLTRFQISRGIFASRLTHPSGRVVHEM